MPETIPYNLNCMCTQTSMSSFLVLLFKRKHLLFCTSKGLQNKHLFFLMDYMPQPVRLPAMYMPPPPAVSLQCLIPGISGCTLLCV